MFDNVYCVSWRRGGEKEKRRRRRQLECIDVFNVSCNEYLLISGEV